MVVAHHLITNGGIKNVTTSYWVKNLHLPLVASIKSMLEFKWYRMTCRNELE